MAVVAALAGLIVVDSAASAQEAPIRNAGGPDAIKDSYIVVLKDAVSVQAVDATVSGLAARHGATVKDTYRSALSGFSATMGEQQAKRLAAEPEVAYVEQDRTVRIAYVQDDPPWGVDRLDERSLPLDDSYTYSAYGYAVRVYVIDTGIRITHDEFGSRASYGRDTVNDDNDANDCHGHGTHVAGTVGGTTYGVAKGVKLIAVKVLNCQGNGTTGSIVQGVDWVTANHIKPAVANMSLIDIGGSDAIDDAVRGSIDDGITYTVAAGNEDHNACGDSPGRVSQAVTVGATTSTDARASFSSFGNCLDLFAPGKSILSAWNGSDTDTATANGTSMAAPHAAGAAALYLAKKPNATPWQVGEVLVENATYGKVSDAGWASPNRLLFSPYGPVITGFWCGSTPHQFSCQLGHAFGTAPIAIRWYVNGTHRPVFDNDLSVYDGCTANSSVKIRAIVTAGNGATEANATFNCEESG